MLNQRTYDEFKRHIPLQVLPLFDSIREFCLSLDEKVIEDVRMHRVVFCKSMTFRWFADVEADHDGVIIKIQKSRKESPLIISVNCNQDISNVCQIIKKAYEEIH